MWDPYQHFETCTLANGLRVHVLHWPERPGVRFAFGIASGARHDPVGKEGSAHFMEHLVSSNGGSSVEALKDFFELNTGNKPNLGGTSFSWTRYDFYSSAEPGLLRTSLDLFGAMLLHAKLEHHLERERAVIVGEFNRRYPTTDVYEWERRMENAVFPGTFLSRMTSPLGTPESIQAIMREDLQSFYDTHYVPTNMEVVAVGELSADAVVKYLEQSPFGIHKPGTRAAQPLPLEAVPAPLDTLEMHDMGARVQGLTAAQYLSVAQLPGAIPFPGVGIFQKMLYRRLFELIRQENRWAYSLVCGSDSYDDFHRFYIQCPGLATTAIDRIEQVVSDCIMSLPEQVELFESTKRGTIIVKRFNDPNMDGIAQSALGDALEHGRVLSLAEDIENVEKVSIEHIHRIAEGLSRERRRTCISHP